MEGQTRGQRQMVLYVAKRQIATHSWALLWYALGLVVDACDGLLVVGTTAETTSGCGWARRMQLLPNVNIERRKTLRSTAAGTAWLPSGDEKPNFGPNDAPMEKYFPPNLRRKALRRIS